VGLQLYYWPSFERSVKKLGHEQRCIVGLIIEALETYYSSGCDLDEAKKVAPRFFYKQLRRPLYEAGVEGKIRIIIEMHGERCTALLAGSHDQIRRFLAAL
jgi:hypothetical protein